MSGTLPGVVTGNIAGVATTLGGFNSISDTGLPVVHDSWLDLRSSSPDKVLLAWGTGGPDGGSQHSAGALVVVPKPGTGSTFYCATSVAASASPDDRGEAVSIALTDLSLLGECPGTKVSGEVDVCLDGSDTDPDCTEDFGVKGSVDGSEVRLKYLGGFSSAGYVDGEFSASVMGDDGDGGVILFDDPGDGELRGWLRVPDDAKSNAGSVFCLSGAFVAAQPSGGYAIAFRSVGRLGPCPGTPVAGELGYCHRFD